MVHHLFKSGEAHWVSDGAENKVPYICLVFRGSMGFWLARREVEGLIPAIFTKIGDQVVIPVDYFHVALLANERLRPFSRYETCGIFCRLTAFEIGLWKW